MNKTKLYYGEARINQGLKEVALKTLTYEGEAFFKIDNYDQMDPFFMTIVSDTDFWMFISSTGGLTTGRKNPENALFPYETDDKIHDSCDTAGPQTIFILSTDHEKQFIWKPFTRHHSGVYNITRNLYKNTKGNKIVFEEENHDLKIIYRYAWKTSDKYGFVKESEVINTNKLPMALRLLDGIRNILPYGINTLIQSTKSTLADGYKRNELIESVGLGIYNLSSIISDKAEPSESLKATTVWSVGLDQPTYLLSEGQVQKFSNNESVHTEHDIKGRRGAYYVSDTFDLSGGASKKWSIVSELNQSASDIEALIEALSEKDLLQASLTTDILRGDENLERLVFEADGLQLTENVKSGYRHFSNTLFNIMRGGIYADGYAIDTNDFKEFVKKWNKAVYTKYSDRLDGLSPVMDYQALVTFAGTCGDADLLRMVLEYLPLTYSRRHGDPSRPWNKFNIEVTKATGDKQLNFEGNWRDIFQNWEALSISYPAYLEGVIAKFVNASSADGYNPYRITKGGIDWEVLDPADPWSNIGYWGDHQIIYLLKLMEQSRKYNADKLGHMLDKSLFVYANIPYRINGFEALMKDPRNTIQFDDGCEALVQSRVSEIGSDGKLVFVKGEIYHVNLMEKLLVTLLSKLSNFVPEGGIWMNTQRPEWNDANNALVGNGVSMVTLYYLHRYLEFLETLMSEAKGEFEISEEVVQMLEGIYRVFSDHSSSLNQAISDEMKFSVVSQLGTIGESYRNAIYANGFTAVKSSLSVKKITAFIEISKSFLKDTIVKNRREDGLYNAYNLLAFSKNACHVTPLYEMLEGQVAVLSSKALSTGEVLSVLKALRNSAMYRADQDSYMLYPNRSLPKFLEKNVIPEASIKGSYVLDTEIKKGHTRFVVRDIHGKYHFNGQFRNGDELLEAILATGEYADEEAKLAAEVFTAIFNHHAFTGRSGTFYKYEGLGCIYWHMVSKLVLVTQECFYDAVAKEGLSEEVAHLADYFNALKAGIGVDKSPVAYGAFPTDAYSHTPGFAGVQQPGMTGQVKEDILTRFNELGVIVKNGEIHFEPLLLAESEMLKAPCAWELPSGSIELEANQLGFTLASVPIIYSAVDERGIVVYYKNGDCFKFEETTKLKREISESLFSRIGDIDKIVVNVDIRKFHL